MRHFKKIDWSISLSLLFTCVLTVIAACVEPSGPLGGPNVVEGGTTVASVQITLAQSTLAPGQTTQATVVATSADGKVVAGRVDFLSQNPSIAAVSSKGVVTAAAAGIAVIQATVAGHGATAPVTVQSIVFPIAAVAVAIDSTKISVGHVAQASAVVKDTAGNPITGQTVTWSSLTPNIASVSSSGAVTAIAAGTASIQATASGVNGSASIIVEAPQSVAPSVASVAVAFDSTRISVGHATQASAVVKDATGSIMAGQAITWSSLTPGIASVSSSGVVTAIAAGTASIRATASGISGSASIIVGPPSVAVVIVTVDSTTLSIGHTAQASATAKDLAGNTINGQTVMWTSLSPSVVTVSSSGKITALAVGIAVIQATISGCSGSSSPLEIQSASSVFAAPDLAFWNFDDGTIGPYTNSWGVDLDFPDDPTGSGKGKVARLHYVRQGSDDANRAMSYTHKRGFGEPMFFRGEFYLPVSDLTGGGTYPQRKLVYWQGPSDYAKYPANGGLASGRTVVMLFGNTMSVDATFNPEPGTGRTSDDVRTHVDNIATGLQGNRWYTLEVEQRMETSLGGADGVLRVWLDGVLIFEKLTMTWSDPAWVGDTSNGIPFDASDIYFHTFLVGDQVNYSGAFDEYRYWDNVGFSTQRIGN